jgi:exodeoxyribonuclease VII large subunit
MAKYNLPVDLQEGSEIIIQGCPGIYVPYGKYTFRVRNVQLIGEGILKKMYEKLKKQLTDEGLFLEKYKKRISKFPTKIGLITSLDAAAYTDILKILQQRWVGLTIYVKPVLVQGVFAKEQIADAIKYFNENTDMDIILLSRGGGSLEDLQAFNSEEVCRAIFASKIAIVTGIGHERDITLAGLVADKRASTPTNAAEVAVPDKNDIINFINEYYKRIDFIIKRLMDHKRFCLKNDFEQINKIIKIKLDIKKDLIMRYERLVKNINPLFILQKGYSITYDKNGKLIKSVSQIKKNDIIKTKLYDGCFNSKVK